MLIHVRLTSSPPLTLRLSPSHSAEFWLGVGNDSPYGLRFRRVQFASSLDAADIRFTGASARNDQRSNIILLAALSRRKSDVETQCQQLAPSATFRSGRMSGLSENRPRRRGSEFGHVAQTGTNRLIDQHEDIDDLVPPDS